MLTFNLCFKGLRSNRCCDAAFLRCNRCCNAAFLRCNRCCDTAFLRRKCVRLAATLPPVRRKHDRDAATLPPVRCKRVCNAATVCRLCVANAVATQRLCLTGTLGLGFYYFLVLRKLNSRKKIPLNLMISSRRCFRLFFIFLNLRVPQVLLN